MTLAAQLSDFSRLVELSSACFGCVRLMRMIEEGSMGPQLWV